jgi:predicted Ser/Thr protein kinase
MRVNARLDDESREQIEYLTAATGMGVSQVLRESVALYYRQARAIAGGAKHLLALAGKGQSGRSDIASDVKRHVAEVLSAKHGVPTGVKRPGR